MTKETLNVIKQILPKGTILDFGAGTGRLSFPLKEQGYNVIAVEISIGMVNDFKRKLDGQNFEIEIYNCSISEYENGIADLAIALFTVLSYSITEDEFKIRYWEISTLDKLLSENGFNDTLESFPQFSSTGSTYKLYKRE